MAMHLKRGLVHLYTGDGKGKTTAALGLALRAAGCGMKVYIHQFAKGRTCGELNALKKIKNITIERCGRACLIKNPTAKDIAHAKEGITKARKRIMSRKYDLVVLDEINIALQLGLVELKEVIELIRNKPPSVELVLTGRYCPPELFKYADLITEMREIKHPYHKGIPARKGIEY